MRTDHVSVSELKLRLRIVAKLVRHDQIYLPIFERLEREIEAAARQNSVMERVLALAA